MQAHPASRLSVLHNSCLNSLLAHMDQHRRKNKHVECWSDAIHVDFGVVSSRCYVDTGCIACICCNHHRNTVRLTRNFEDPQSPVSHQKV